MQQLPKINKEYDCYDDGKIKESRRLTVKITAIIPFADADYTDVLELWHQEIEDASFLYAKETDYFISGILPWGETVYFVRTIHGEWFSIGYHGVLLDITNELKNNENYNKPFYARY